MARRDPFEPSKKSARGPRVVRERASASETPPPFVGFPEGGRAFLEALAKKQDRDWFSARKAEYEALWHAPMTSLLSDARAALDDTYPMVSESTLKVFRIHRDTRFSKDKTPYKTHCAGSLSLSGGLPMSGTGLYVQLGLEGEFFAAGRWMLEKEALEKFRAAVASDAGAVLEKRLEAARKRGFELIAHETLKRVPAPYAADHPRAELLRLKGFALRFPAPPPGLAQARKLLPWLVKQTKTVSTVLEWLDDAVA
jgi:uncharacterized protein (TIGR02453 family)